MLSIDINDAGQAVLQIADADGELHAYCFRLVPRGLSLWALEVTRADTGATYRVGEEWPGGRWTCNCPAETYRRRGADHCKHIDAARAFRAWLRDFTEGTAHVEHHRTRAV